MIKKRSSKEIIQASLNPKKEQAYIQLPGQELQEITEHSGEGYVYTDSKKIEKILLQNCSNQYAFVHTHPVHERFWFLNIPEGEVRKEVYPSVGDIYELMKDPKRREGIIAARGIKSGKVYGYLILRKTKETPVIGENGENATPAKQYPLYRDPSETVEDYQRDLEKICKAYNLKFKIMGLAGPKKRKVVATILISFLILSLFFLFPEITGNTIVNRLNSNSSFIGAGIFILCLITSFFWIKLRRNSHKPRKPLKTTNL